METVNWLTQIERQGAPGYTMGVIRSLGRLNKKLEKLLCIISPIFEMTEFNAKMTIKINEGLYKKKIPHFDNIAEAALALKNTVQYAKYLKMNT